MCPAGGRLVPVVLNCAWPMSVVLGVLGRVAVRNSDVIALAGVFDSVGRDHDSRIHHVLSAAIQAVYELEQSMWPTAAQIWLVL